MNKMHMAIKLILSYIVNHAAITITLLPPLNDEPFNPEQSSKMIYCNKVGQTW